MIGFIEGINDYKNYDMCGMMSHTISDKNICYRRYPCPTSSGFDTRLFVFVSENNYIVFVFEAICIRIRIQIIKMNMVSVIFAHIQSDYTLSLRLNPSYLMFDPHILR
jgi:hypothetical protein